MGIFRKWFGWGGTVLTGALILAWKIFEDWALSVINGALSEWLGIQDFRIEQSWPVLVDYGVPVLIGLLVFGACYGIYRLLERETPAGEAQNVASVQPTPSTPPAPFEPDMTVREAVDHVALALELPNERLDEAFDAIIQAARLGTIRVWGRPKSIDVSPYMYQRPRHPISPEHWDDYMFDVLGCLMRDARQCKTVPLGRNSDERDGYIDMILDRDEVSRRWRIPEDGR